MNNVHLVFRHLHLDLSDIMRESKMDIVSTLGRVQTCALKSLLPNMCNDVFESIQIEMSLILAPM